MTLPRNFTVCKTAFAGKPRSYGIEADRQIWEDFNPVGRKLGAGTLRGIEQERSRERWKWM